MKPFSKLLGFASIVVIIDRLSKNWILEHFSIGDSHRITSFFYLTLVNNTGSAFGFLQRHNGLLLGISCSILLGLLFSAWSLCDQGGQWAFWGLALIIGGAIGNMIDRWAYGLVIDFLDFRVWPVFNLADSSICVGAGFLGLGLFRKR